MFGRPERAKRFDSRLLFEFLHPISRKRGCAEIFSIKINALENTEFAGVGRPVDAGQSRDGSLPYGVNLAAQAPPEPEAIHRYQET
jgi:hypothetical protein